MEVAQRVEHRPLLHHRRMHAPLLILLAVSCSTASVAFAGGGAVGPEQPSSANLLSGGLINLGNTCYLNSQLECAYHVPRVRDLITSPPSDPATVSGKATQPSVALLSMGHIFSTMQAASQKGLGGYASPVSTSDLCRNLGIPIWEQQDSQEFWKLLLPELKLPQLVDLYQGSYEGYIAALDGSGREKKREEQFLDLSLEVSSGSILRSLEDMFCKPELLSEKEGNGWRPEKGADKVDALKGSLLRANGLPSLLQLHLMRFQYDWQTDMMSKINDRFRFPKVLDLSKICTDIQKDEIPRVVYDLQSIVVHVGEYGSGHYYAYCRPDVRKNTWYRFDDDKVTEVDFKEVMADSYGGQSRRKEAKEEPRGFFSRLLGFGEAGKFGWGGRTSSAYMLQYVRRSDVPMLYGE